MPFGMLLSSGQSCRGELETMLTLFVATWLLAKEAAVVVGNLVAPLIGC